MWVNACRGNQIVRDNNVYTVLELTPGGGSSGGCSGGGGVCMLFALLTPTKLPPLTPSNRRW